jgi:hypothetical protein
MLPGLQQADLFAFADLTVIYSRVDVNFRGSGVGDPRQGHGHSILLPLPAFVDLGAQPADVGFDDVLMLIEMNEIYRLAPREYAPQVRR